MDWAGEGKMPGKLGGSRLMLTSQLNPGSSLPAASTWHVTAATVFMMLFTQAMLGVLQSSECASGLFTCAVNGAAFRCPYKLVINYFPWAKVKRKGRIESDSTEDLYSPSPTRRPSTSNIWSNFHSSDAWEMEDLLVRQRLGVGVKALVNNLELSIRQHGFLLSFFFRCFVLVAVCIFVLRSWNWLAFWFFSFGLMVRMTPHLVGCLWFSSLRKQHTDMVTKCKLMIR